MAWAFDASLRDELQAARLPRDVVAFVQSHRGELAALQLPPQTDAATAAAVHRAVGDAFVTGFRWVMGVSAALALGGAAISAVFVRADAGQGEKKDRAS
jgi:hypothetical protein